MSYLSIGITFTLFGVIELHIWAKYWEEIRLEPTGHICCLTSSSVWDLILTDYDAWSFMRLWINVLYFYWHKVYFIWSYETPVMSHGTLIYVDAKLSNSTLNFVDAKTESYDTDFCWHKTKS